MEGEEWRSFAGNATFENLSDQELEEIRDKYILDYLTCAFGHPNIDSFYFWGFIGMAVKFRNDYDSSHEMQPIFNKVKDLIHKEWKTNLTLKTDAHGKIDFRGFCGEYSLKIKPGNGQVIGHRFHIDQKADINSLVIKTVLA